MLNSLEEGLLRDPKNPTHADPVRAACALALLVWLGGAVVLSFANLQVPVTLQAFCVIALGVAAGRLYCRVFERRRRRHQAQLAADVAASVAEERAR